jgi:hypothetical protein
MFKVITTVGVAVLTGVEVAVGRRVLVAVGSTTGVSGPGMGIKLGRVAVGIGGGGKGVKVAVGSVVENVSAGTRKTTSSPKKTSITNPNNPLRMIACERVTYFLLSAKRLFPFEILLKKSDFTNNAAFLG